MSKAPTIEASKENLTKDLKAVVASAEDLLAATAAQGGEKIVEARARAQEALRNAREKLAEIQEDVVTRAKEAAEVTDQYVHENPWTAIGVGAGIGFLLGLLIGRR